MHKRRQGNLVIERIVSAAVKADGVKVALATAVLIIVVSIIAYVLQTRWRLGRAQPLPLPTMQKDADTQNLPDSTESPLLGDALIVGRLMAQADPNKISAPSVGIGFGRQPGAADNPDLSAPATAVHEVLALIDKGAADQLSQCFAPGAEDAAGGLYPRYVGPPVEVVEVAEEGAVGKVLWKATVRGGFTLEGRDWSPGETITLETRLICVDGVWKLARLYEHHP
jgi:hypothetical protein